MGKEKEKSAAAQTAGEVLFDLSDLGTYDRDEVLEAEMGIWIDFAGRKLRLLRAGGSNRRYTRYMQRHSRPLQRQTNRGQDIPNEALEALVRKAYANTVIVDWKGVNGPDGRPVPFTPENVEKFLQAVPEIFDEVIRIASNRAMFQREFVQELGQLLGETLPGL